MKSMKDKANTSLRSPSMRLLAASLALSSLVYPSQFSCAQEVNTSDSQGVNVTIYNQDFGLIKDIRNIELRDGINNLRFSDVAARIDPTTVSLQSLTAPNTLVVREQNYQYDLIDPRTILNKSVGKTLKFRQYLDSGSVREFTGTLLNSPTAVVSDPNGNSSTRYQGLVVKSQDGVILDPRGEIEVAELPPGLISKPSLLWKLETTKPGTHRAEVAYQTSGLNWNCDYVAIINNEDNQSDLTSWVTLNNRSGATYNNASLKLMAGDVHKVTQPGAVGMAGGAMRMKAMNMAPQFQEQSFAEYHLYTLKNKTDLKDNETKQLSLFNADNIPVKKLFVYEPQQNQGYGWRRGGNDNQKVNVKIEIENSQKNNLGMPMPKGKVRVYKKDSDGALQFIGEDMIDHTPKDEKVRLYIGDAFDVVGEYRQTNVQRISDRVQRTSYEMSIRNHKNSDITVVCVDHAYGDWTIVSSTMAHTKKDSRTFEFTPKVPANGEVKIAYTVETRW